MKCKGNRYLRVHLFLELELVSIVRFSFWGEKTFCEGETDSNFFLIIILHMKSKEHQLKLTVLGGQRNSQGKQTLDGKVTEAFEIVNQSS